MTENVDHSKNTPAVLSFCSGYGGIERGLDIVGFKHRVITYVEIESYAAANLVAKMESNQLDAAPIYTDLKTFPSEIFRDKISLITGGYPCGPFSGAGLRKGTEDSRHLWPYIRKHIQSIRPLQCFFENVEGHISLGLREVISDLESLGYKTTWGIFSAREVGAPHQRKRVFILADSSGAGQQALRDKLRAKRTAQIISKSSELGYSQNDRCEGWSENIKRERSENIGERSDKDLWGKSERSSEALADPNDRRRKVQVEGRQSSKQVPKSESKERRTCNGQWEIEPRLGRVVDGCPNRVDRLRLLGNGVVPQTAAKAWVTLNQKLLEQNETRCG